MLFFMYIKLKKKKKKCLVYLHYITTNVCKLKVWHCWLLSAGFNFLSLFVPKNFFNIFDFSFSHCDVSLEDFFWSLRFILVAYAKCMVHRICTRQNINVKIIPGKCCTRIRVFQSWSGSKVYCCEIINFNVNASDFSITRTMTKLVKKCLYILTPRY